MRVALFGVGRLGASHAKDLAALDGVSELRIFDADAERARSVAAGLGARPMKTVDEALDGAGAAVIVTPTASHAELIRRCIQRGLPVFCEKPIAIDLADTKAVVEEVERRRARVQIGFQRRFDMGYRRARDMLRAGALGTVYSFYMTSRDATPPPDSYVETSGGQFKDQMIHDLDITRWLFESEVEEVSATGTTLGFDQYRAFGDVGTSAVLLRLASGALGLVCAARHNEAGYDIRVEIHGAKDTIAIGLDQRAPIRSVEATAPPLAGPPYASFFERFGDAYRAELAHFLRFATGDAENACTARDALEALRVAEAAGRSWRERRPVRLDEVA